MLIIRGGCVFCIVLAFQTQCTDPLSISDSTKNNLLWNKIQKLAPVNSLSLKCLSQQSASTLLSSRFSSPWKEAIMFIIICTLILQTSLSFVCIQLGHPFTEVVLCVCVHATHGFTSANIVCARGHFNDLRNNSSVVDDRATMCVFLHMDSLLYTKNTV